MNKTVLSLVIGTILLGEGALVYAEPGTPPGAGNQPTPMPMGEKPEQGMNGQPKPEPMGEKPEQGMDGQPMPMGEKPEQGMDGQPMPMGEKPEQGMDGQPMPEPMGEKPEQGMDGQPMPEPMGEKPEQGMDGQPIPMPVSEKPAKSPKPNKPLQDMGVDSEQIQHFDKNKVKELKPEQFAKFDRDNVRDLPVDAVGEFTAEQFKSVGKEAAKGFKPEHVAHIPPAAFQGLSRENLGGLEAETVRAITTEQLDQINQDEVQALPDREQARLLANLDPEIDAEKIKGFLPPGWTIGNGKGLGRPVGAPVELPPLPAKEMTKLKLSKVSDLRQGFGFGGNIAEGETDALTGINNMLEGTGFTVEQQEEGVLRVTGEGNTELAFLPDSENMAQGDPNAEPGIMTDKAGNFVLAIKGGYQIPVKPACKDPAGLAEALPETGELEVDDNAQVRVQLDDSNVVSGVCDFSVFDAPTDLPPGVHIVGEGHHKEMMMVYKNGQAQMAKPAVKSPAKFQELAMKFPGVQEIVIHMDGTIHLIYEGMPLLLRPALEVTPPLAADVEAGNIPEPTIEITDEGMLQFVDDQGDTQELSIELDEEMDVIPDVVDEYGEASTGGTTEDMTV
jgi:hypothetical protein